MALQRQSISIPISEGIDTKTDSKQVMAGKALSLENARFQKIGKLSKRFGQTILTDTTNLSGLSTYNPTSVLTDEKYLGAVTDSGVFNYLEGQNKWRKISEYFGSVNIQSEFFSKSGSQELSPNADFNNGIHACTYNAVSPVNFAYFPQIIIEDFITSSRLELRLNITTVTVNQPNISILGTSASPSIFHFNPTSTGLELRIYNSDLVLQSSATIGSLDYQISAYDVFRYQDTIYLATVSGASLSLYAFTHAGGVTPTLTGTYTITGGNHYVVSSTPCGFSLCVNATNVVIAYIDSNSGGQTSLVSFNKTFSLVVARKTVTTALDLRKVALTIDDQFAYVSSSTGEQILSQTVLNKISYTTSAAAFSSTVINRPRLLARPFIINSNAYVPIYLAETGQENGYIVKFSDGLIVSKFCVASIYDQDDLNIKMWQVPNTPQLSANTVSVFYTGIYNQLSDLGDNPLNFVGVKKTIVDFSAQSLSKGKIGETVYSTSGLTFESDGRGFYENGFFQNPDQPSVSVITGVANPNVANKTFSYAAVYEYFDANGQLAVSAPSLSISTGNTGASCNRITVGIKTPFGSLRPQDQFANTAIMITIYRTTDNGSVFYKLASYPTSVNTGVRVFFDDTTSDAAIQNNQVLYTTGNILENNQAPSAKFSAFGGNRLFLGGLEETDEIAFSKKQLFGESIAFSDFFRIRVSTGSNADKTPISALGYMDGKLVIFREQSLYYIQGDGPNETGTGSFSDPEPIQSDVGCIEPRSVLSTPMGLMFKSRKGIYLLSRNLQVSYVGAPVEDFNSEIIVSSVLHDKYNECRFYTKSKLCLVYNYLFESWSVFTNQTDYDCDTWKGEPILIRNKRIYKESDLIYTDDGSFYSMKFVSPWLKLDLIQGYIRTYQLWIIGDYRSAHTLKCRVYTDYDNSTYEDYSLVYSNTDSPQYQFQISLPKQKVESVKFEIFDTNHQVASTGEAYDLSNIQVEVGIKSGGYKLAASKSY